MRTNFDFLMENKQFKSFAEQAVEAERGLMVSSSNAAILTRRALELAVRWVYTHDTVLSLPYRDNLSSLVHENTFRDILEPRLFPMLTYIIKLGNHAVHTNNTVKRDEAVVSLRNLFEFCQWIAYCYAPDYKELIYDESILATGEEQKQSKEQLEELYKSLGEKDRKLEEICRENQELRKQMSAVRIENENTRIYQLSEKSEKLTREKYIDLMLRDAGWVIGADCLTEFPVSGMPITDDNKTGNGKADYVLFGDDSLPLAVVEAKRTSVNPMNGKIQAKAYADCLEKKYNRRPFVFTTNGFETYFTDYDYPNRRVSGIFTKEDLQRYMDRRSIQIPLEKIDIKNEITNRPYQKEAVMAVCDSVMKRQRKMLIVQATGSGKTRVSISIVDVLRRHNYVKNVLFLADRIALVRQAKRSFHNLLPDMTACNLLEDKEDPEQCRLIFSTYATMMNAIDDVKRKDGKKLFTPAHFDLIIIDESHRSVYKKYQEIFHYFDALQLGMTATPKEDLKNTYEVFELESGVPTFAYDLVQAVDEGYLVNYTTIEYETDIMKNGIHYNELSDDEKTKFEQTFAEDERIDEDISSDAVNQWLFNKDTVDKVLNELMDKGLKVEGGDKLGKTIIFAKNKKHADYIVKRFNDLYPEYGDGFAEQVYDGRSYVEALIDNFSDKGKKPQIAVSVDMLDTGIDVPEILNLVFFKKVKSYAKFWQMIGRGTRLCENLFGPELDKQKFLIFDFCGNFDYFRVNKHGEEVGIQQTLNEKIFNCKVRIAEELQAPEYQTEEVYRKHRVDIVDDLHKLVMELNNDSFRVKKHMQYVEMYRDKLVWQCLENKNVNQLQEHIAPLIVIEKDNELAKRFDYLMYSIELAELQGRNALRNIKIVNSTASKLTCKYTIPQVRAKQEVIEQVLKQDFWEKASIKDMETIRVAFRELVQYLDSKGRVEYYTDFEDNIVSMTEGEPLYISNDLQSYRQKVEFYLKEHKDNLCVYKLRNNKKLTISEMHELERILWNELGSREEYRKEYGETPVGVLIRRIVGVDKAVVNEAFSEFLTEEHLNLNQLRFVRMIVDYISANGMIENNAVLMNEPFKSVGSISLLFKEDKGSASKIMQIVEDIRRNAIDIA